MEFIWYVILAVFLFFLFGIRIIRPTHRGLIELLVKYRRFAHPGFNWIIPGIEKMYSVNVTEQMVNA
ncbi:MAG: SPFH/Band 7/PHB domain protein, partial [Bacteroidota bacterium]|nr:SPFH/Band 7/PHB domain protein [Bacteroidota bacterium]